MQQVSRSRNMDRGWRLIELSQESAHMDRRDNLCPSLSLRT